MLGCELFPALVRPPFSGWSSFTGHLRASAPDKTLDLCFPRVLCLSIGNSSAHRIHGLTDEFDQRLFIRTALGIEPAWQWKAEGRNRNGQAIAIQDQQPISIDLENHIPGLVQLVLGAVVYGDSTKLFETE